MSLIENIPEEFYKDFDTWFRLEPRCRSNDFARGLEARLADPLWMLARQWQTGEFQGEDAGTPISARIKHSAQSIDRVWLGNSEAAQDFSNTPLEMLVEREDGGMDWRLRVQIGQRFERIIQSREYFTAEQKSNTIETLRSNYLLELPAGEDWAKTDYATRRFLEFMNGRAIDGESLLEDIKNQRFTVPADITTGQWNNVILEFNKWSSKLLSQPSMKYPEAWQKPQLEYRFNASSSDDEATSNLLTAPDYRNGTLDWYTFDVAKGIQDHSGAWLTPSEVTVHPTPITVGGASPRWWAFEDSNIDFGRLDVAKPDLGTLMLMEFALIYGDDWFSVPLTVKTSNLIHIDELCVQNVFGEEIAISSARNIVSEAIKNSGGDPNEPLLRWEIFALSPALDSIPVLPPAGNPDLAGVADVLLVPPVAGFREESKPIEEVRFLRDEGANMIFGVEHLVRNGMGRPVDGFDAQRERFERERDFEISSLATRLAEIEAELKPADLLDQERSDLEKVKKEIQDRLAMLRDGSTASTGGVPRYRLATTIPENWFPFIPTNAGVMNDKNYRSMLLRRAQMLRNADDENPTPIPAMSRLLDLSEDPLLWLEEAAVPRSGLRVQLTAQRVRWVDGKTYVWLGRKVTTGKGEGSSGLKFDVIGGK